MIIILLLLQKTEHIYSKYPNYQVKIKDSILKRKAELENMQSQIISDKKIIPTNKISENGIDRSTNR